MGLLSVCVRTGVCLLACVVPTRRALSVEPTEVLRVESWARALPALRSASTDIRNSGAAQAQPPSARVLISPKYVDSGTRPPWEGNRLWRSGPSAR